MATRKKRKKGPKRKTGKKSRPKKKKSALKKIAKWHSLLAIAVLILYLTMGFWLGPGALQRDIEGKVAGATTVLSLRIAGPPGKPGVVATPGYHGNSPHIDLDWSVTTEDEDITDYDIFRDAAVLVTGVTNTHYRDENVVSGVTYSYYVVANGPLGSTQSNSVAVTVPEAPVPPPPPPEDVVCRITTLNSIDLTNFRCLPKAKKKRPVFSGTTNVSGAQIQAEISSRSLKRKVTSSFSANENGYWSWGVQSQLKKGTKIISVKAIDPSDASRFGTCSLRFKISQKGYSKKKMKKCTGAVTYQALFVPPGYKFSPSLNLQFKNYEKSVFTGDSLELEADFRETILAGVPDQKVSFQFIDSKNNTVYQTESSSWLDKNRKVTESLKVPLYIRSGQYRAIAQVMRGEEIITTEKDFAVKEKPIVQLSPNWSLTYVGLLSNLGWAVIISMAILLVFFGLLAFEYHLSQYAAIQVTEKELKKEGYID